jgi:hypothetical protein
MKFGMAIEQSTPIKPTVIMSSTSVKPRRECVE